MKKHFIALLVLVIFCCANLALAAGDPFSDVPAKHWAYDAVNKLVKAGIVTGTNGGVFQGDRTLTRYEMALIVANAMTKVDKNDAANKVIVDKLVAEFANELQALGKRMDGLEKKQGPLTISGFLQQRQESLSNPYTRTGTGLEDTNRKEMTRTALWLDVKNQFDGDTYFHGVLWSESFPGVVSQNVFAQVHEAYVAKRIGDGTELAVGMFFPTIGRGTLMSTPMMQGARLSYAKDAIKANLYTAKFNVDYVTNNGLATSATGTNFAPGGMHYTMGDLTYSLNKDADVSLAFVSDGGVSDFAGTNNSIYKQTAVGAEYRGITDITFTGEYGVNKSDAAKSFSGKNQATAYFAKAKYKGANPFVPGSTGVYVEYKRADNGFDPLANAGPVNWNSVFNTTAGAGGGSANDIKGFEYEFEATVAPRLIFSTAYDSLKAVSDNQNRSYLTAQFFYLF